MRNYILLTFLFAILALGSCSEKPKFGQPNVDFKAVEKDFLKWWTYHNNNIVLSSDFIAIDNSSKIIDKDAFLKNLTTGDFIPLKLSSKDSVTYYQLFKLDQTADKEISKTIKSTSTVLYNYFKMEGKHFPTFDFTDLKGIEYNNENTKGKIIVLKCWFIACHACVAEFPILNELVEKYHNRNDIIFISLAVDQKEELIQFLSKKAFSYSVVANQKQFISNDLGITGYPTHFIIDRKGIIKKVVNRAEEMMVALDAETVLKPK
jgi:thiol-disulfide isomerase/thioredoxin